MSFAGKRYTGATSDDALISVGASQRCRILAIHLSVPAGQNAQIEFDDGTDVVIVSTETAVNLPIPRGQVVGAKGQDVLVTTSGAGSVGIVYEMVSR